MFFLTLQRFGDVGLTISTLQYSISLCKFQVWGQTQDLNSQPSEHRTEDFTKAPSVLSTATYANNAF